MIIEKPRGGGDFTPTPEGQHTGICCRVVDFGTHVSTGVYAGKRQRKLMIGWELPDTRIDFQDKSGQQAKGPAIHIERYTWSFHKRANLRKMLESWRGQKFVESDFEGESAFNMKNLIGVPAMMQIVHSHKDGKTYSNLSTIMKSPIARKDWPKIEGEAVFLDLRNFDQAAFDLLSDYWQNLIKATPEWREMFGAGIDGNEMGSQSENPAEGFEDPVPF